MTTEAKQETNIPEKRIVGESLVRYSLVDGVKVYQFSFPNGSSLEENFAALSYLRDALLKIIEQNQKLEKEFNEDKETKLSFEEWKVEKAKTN